MRDPIRKLLYATGRGNLPYVREYLSKGGSINVCNHVGGTPLMSACASHRVEIVEFALQAGARVDSKTTDGRTALHAAVGSTPLWPEYQRDCVRLLLGQGAEIDVQDATGVTPLMNAAWFGCTLAVVELINAGASLGLKDAQGRTARDLASVKDRIGIVEIINEAGGSREEAKMKKPGHA